MAWPNASSGIDENQRHDLFDSRVHAVHLEKGDAFGIVGHIDHRQPQILAHLRSGQTHAVRIHHRVEHVGDQLDDRIIHLCDGPAALTKDWMTVLDDFANHGNVSGCLSNESAKVKHEKSIHSGMGRELLDIPFAAGIALGGFFRCRRLERANIAP